MSDVNVIVMSGRLCTDPTIRYTTDGMAVANLRLASNRKRKDRENVTFIDISIFGRLAEATVQHRKKGDAITVTGPLSLNQWEDKEGAKHSRHFIIANEVSFGPKARANGEEPVSATAPGSDAAQTEPADDDIPF